MSRQRRPRIEPVQPPYEPEIDAELRGMMPRNSPVEPLKLFRTLARHRPLAAAMTALGRDRKSTRLNSSHRCISYAVFCLKKKKKTTKQTIPQQRKTKVTDSATLNTQTTRVT